MAKKERNTALITGIVLFVLAAVFSISLISGAFNYSGNTTGLAKLGTLLISAYGICSILIPVFFLTAGIFSFSSKWSIQRALALTISLLPFFTLVWTERTCRKIFNTDTSAVAFMKIIILCIIALLLVAVEYLVTFIIYTRLKKLKEKNIIKKAGFKLPKIKSKKHSDKDSSEEILNDADFSDDADDEAFEPTDDREKTEWTLTDVLEEKENKEEVKDEDDIWSLDTNGNLKSMVQANGGSDNFSTNADDDIWDVTAEDSEETASDDASDNIEEAATGADDTTDEASSEEAAADTGADSVKDNSLEDNSWAKAPHNIEVVELRDIVDPTVKTADDASETAESDIIDQFEKDSIGYEDENDSDEKDEPIDFEINFDEPEPDFTFKDKSIKTSSPMFSEPDFSEVEDLESIDEKEDSNDETKDDGDSDDEYVNLDFDVIESDDSEEHKEEIEEKKTQLQLNNALGSIFSRMEDDAKKSVENADMPKKAAPPAPAPVKRPKSYKIPTDILTAYTENPYWIIDEETKAASEILMETLREFKIEAKVTDIKKGPVVTMIEILPAPGVNLNKIRTLQDNITLRLAAKSVRIVAPIPGKRAVGIEIPNKKRAIVSFRECIEENRPEWKKMAVPVVLGKDIEGVTQLMDLAKTPHLLIAGATGAGKSVCVNSLILSILFKRSPSEVKLILIDPKIVELSLYNGIGHLLTPVITEPKMAMQALQYCICEMERRYAVLKSMGCREIVGYNQKIVEQHIATEKLPYIIIVIDEFADLMATAGKQMEAAVARLAAKSRAVGIHLVLATQRPSVDVITGLIKANIPSRIAFMVASRTDSNIIIDKTGAEKLLGKGDMLYASATDPFPVRIQGTLVSDQEVENVVNAVKDCWGEPDYIDDEIFVPDEDDEDAQPGLFNDGADDPLYDKALDIVVQAGKASASYIQRRLSIGYNRAARLVELMEERGIVGPANGSKPREIIHIP